MTKLDAREHALDQAAFVAASPSSYHAAAELARRLEATGAHRQEEVGRWDSSAGAHYLVRDGAVAAWHISEAAASADAATLAERLEVRIVGSHTDSPTFTLKPQPNVKVPGWAQAAVELYGGLIPGSWFDRELGFAGRITVEKDGVVSTHLTRTGALARIPRIAIHFERSTGTEETFDKQRHTSPVVAALDSDEEDADILAELVRCSDAPEGARVVGHNVMAYDTQYPQLFGFGERLLASGRMDNLSSVHASITAWERLAAAGGFPEGGGEVCAAGAILLPVMIANDHEEIGSNTRTGAAGPMLEDVLARTLGALGLDEEDRRRVLARSSCISADAAHGVHPNYPEKHDPTHRPMLGRGPVTKINGNQRYATDAVSQGIWFRACEAAGVTAQPFVTNNAVPCGSTIGPITATRLGLRIVDVGAPLLSMHSARETVHIQDLADLSAALGAYWAGA